MTSILSDHPLMVRQEALFKLKNARRNEAATADRTESVRVEQNKPEKQSVKQAVKWAEVRPENKTTPPKRTCSAFLGRQLGATRKVGRPYACNYGKECSFAHVSVAGKSNEKLNDTEHQV
jgi:hypothetical protein